MKAQVWCKRNMEKGVPGFLAWEGNISAIPQKDSYIELHDGWCAETVLDVYYSLHDDTATIEIHSDTTGEYRKKAIELGFIKDES